MFAAIGCIGGTDGIRYDVGSMTVETIREDTKYGGTRICFKAFIGTVRLPMQFDIGVGNAITPAPELAEFPVLLGGEKPRLKIYPMVTAIAEKVEAMVTRGGGNSRMKDFYDIWKLSMLARHSSLSLRNAVANTLQRRGTELPNMLPYALTEDFARRPEKTVQWKAFCKKSALVDAPEDFSIVIGQLAVFLAPCFQDSGQPEMLWKPGNGWEEATLQ